MSIIERLFPASELEALRATPYDFDLEHTAKRRKLFSTPSAGDSPVCRSSSDSGYSSDESSPISPSWPASPKRSRSSLSSQSSSSSSQTNPSAKFAQSALFRKYLTSMHPQDRAKYRLRMHSASPAPTPDDMRDFYQKITFARSSSQSSISGLPTPPYSNGGSTHHTPLSLVAGPTEDEAESCIRDVGQGWTAGPKSAAGADLSSRLLDGMRLTSHERSMLNSLIPDDDVSQTSRPRPRPDLEVAPAFTYPQRRDSQIKAPTSSRPSFAGIAIGTYDDEEDELEHADLDGFTLEGEGTGKVEDFFNIEDACDDSPSASNQDETESS